MPAVVSSDAAAFFCPEKKFRMATHVLERREQRRPVLKAAVDAEARKRGASLEEVSRLHNELARGAPVLERLIWARWQVPGGGGRHPGLEGDAEAGADLQLKLRKRLNQRAARSAAPAMAEERGEESWAPMEALREKREALRQRCIRTRNVATLAQIERGSSRWRSSSSARRLLSGCRSCQERNPPPWSDIKAFQLRNAGRVEQTLWADGLEYYHVLQQRAPSGSTTSRRWSAGGG